MGDKPFWQQRIDSLEDQIAGLGRELLVASSALAAERAAHRELRERLQVLSDAASVSGLPHCITYETAGGYCQECWVCALKDLLAALVGWPEGARDGDK